MFDVTNINTYGMRFKYTVGPIHTVKALHINPLYAASPNFQEPLKYLKSQNFKTSVSSLMVGKKSNIL